MKDEGIEGVFIPPPFFLGASFPLFFCEKEHFFPASKEYLVPRFSELFETSFFADVFIGWNHSGLFFQCDIPKKELSIAPIGDPKGDAVEIFIDTRNRKQAKTTHRFCHHFWFLPEQFEGKQKEERDSFRTEDIHPLCPQELLGFSLERKKEVYSMQITIPREALFGYDPELPAIGIAYRIHRKEGHSQDFFIPSSYCLIEQQPAFWVTALLRKEHHANGNK